MAGQIPIDPHVSFTLFLNDSVESEQSLEIDCEIALLDKGSEIWIYTENGVSDGMKAETKFTDISGEN